MKVYDVVKDALTLIQVIDPKQPVKAFDMESGIARLNRMMTQWESRPLPLGWQNVSSPEDEMPTPPEADDAIISNLALRSAASYGVEPMAAVVAQAKVGFEILQRQFLAQNPLDRNVVLPLGSGARRWGMRFGGWWPYP